MHFNIIYVLYKTYLSHAHTTNRNVAKPDEIHSLKFRSIHGSYRWLHGFLEERIEALKP